ncbi:hypothetical protein BLOT_006990 [Blomia tropicalis]|nr:hypothetical protein BLOT_006990 [Blomia tropicalis]
MKESYSYIRLALKLRSQSNNLPRTLKTEINVCISKISGMNVSSDQVEFEEHSEIKIPFSKLSKSSKSRLACVTCPSSKRQQSERKCNLCESPICKAHSVDLIQRKIPSGSIKQR